MPAVAFAVSGRGRAVSPWLNLMERLVGGWSLEPATNWPWRGIHRRVQPLAGSVREWGRAVRGAVVGSANRDPPNAGGLLRIPDQRCDSTEQSLYERLGGVNAIAMVVGRFSDKIVEDAKLDVNPQLQEWKGLVARPEVYADAVALCSGWGPFQYTGKELHEAHRDLRITSEEFDEVRQDIELLGRSVGVANGELEDLPGGNLPFIHIRMCMVMVLVPIGPLSRHVDATPNHHRGIALSRTIANASCNNLCLCSASGCNSPRATRPGGSSRVVAAGQGFLPGPLGG